MRTVVGHLVPIIMVALASMAAVTIATPAVSSAECADGEWWDPTGKVCRPLGVGPHPGSAHLSPLPAEMALGGSSGGRFHAGWTRIWPH